MAEHRSAPGPWEPEKRPNASLGSTVSVSMASFRTLTRTGGVSWAARVSGVGVQSAAGQLTSVRPHRPEMTVLWAERD